ncbi:/ atpB / F-ATPase subunit 6 /:128456 Forward [Candidatus Hepatoplasma crinochetorum]|uniref:/ atpB / F-ATPase subunit 6 /:128456 Forward n=1 Tax=Candidatus Hepatoplasma crinochetorum TaxID=295596 RepID=A0A0G7ZNF6_9MOLU|nr:/ atpB / F-ATPase subunit 6 /:128456 Forward [Candidatus Hepatoplasma crinochetorum]
MNLYSTYFSETQDSYNPLDLVVNLGAFIFTLIVTLIITIIVVWYIYRQVKKFDPEKPATGIVLFTQNYVNGFNNLFDSITGNRLRKAYPYFFTLFNFILVANLLSLINLLPAATSLAFTFTLGIITFIGIYVVGVCTNGLIHFIRHKYANPIEILGQFSPLLSISIRLFGATIAGYVIEEIVVIMVGGLTDNNERAMLFTELGISPGIWVWEIIDSGLTIIQAFVFAVLTCLYWSLDHGPSWNKDERKKHFKAEKELKKQLRQEKKRAKSSG